ncbi:MAG: hypothetical protein ACXWC9_02315, partial [Pseudobdellovibrionaceae bacterium]
TDLESCSVMGAKQVLQVMLDGPNWRGRSQPPKPEKYYVGGTLLDGGSLRSGRKARMDQQADTVTKYDHLLPEAPAGKPAQSSEAAPDSAE